MAGLAEGLAALPPKPGGELKIELGGFTAEMALNLPLSAPALRS